MDKPVFEAETTTPEGLARLLAGTIQHLPFDNVDPKNILLRAVQIIEDGEDELDEDDYDDPEVDAERYLEDHLDVDQLVNALDAASPRTLGLYGDDLARLRKALKRTAKRGSQ